jgi:hypothetical protein
MEAKYLRLLRIYAPGLILLLAVLLLTTCTLKVSADNLGNTASGSTGYPQTNVGNQATTLSSVTHDFLTVDKFTTTVPLTAILMRTYGNVNGNVQVSIYSDNSGSPGTLQFNAVSSAVTGGVWSSITIPNTYLPAGTYWLAFNTDGPDANANRLTKSTDATGVVRKFQALTYGTAFPSTPASASWTNAASGMQDHIYFVGIPIKGYAKATKAVLPANGTFNSMSFYSHAAGNARLAIYNDASGPSAKQWESNDVAVSAGAWTTVNISSGTPSSLILNNGTYWLAWQWNSAASGPSYTAGPAGDGNYMVQTTYGAFPVSWSGGSSSTERWSIYATYILCTPPTIYSVIGSGGYCSGDAGRNVGLSNSETTVNYQLKLNGTNTGSPISGTGLPLDFGIQTLGTYTVEATSKTGGCTNPMSGSAIIAVNPLPSASVNGHTNISCFGGHDGTITILSIGGTSAYQYSVDNGVTYTTGANPNPYTFTGLYANVQYKIRVIDNNGCQSPEIH